MHVETRDRIGPWLPAINCAALGAICTIAGFVNMLYGGAMGDLGFIYMLYMPMCFFFVGTYLAKLRSDNTELRTRLDTIDAEISLHHERVGEPSVATE